MRSLVFTLAVVLAGFTVLVALAWWRQRDMIYFPFGGSVPPAASVLPGARDVRIDTEDGLTLGAWYLPREGATAVVVFSGNAGNRSHRAELAHALWRGGTAVLLFDYRGYGGNPGAPSEGGLIRDGRAAVRWLAGRTGVDPERIAYFGESIGAAVAIAVAVERPPSALVLRSPFTSLVDVGRAHYPFLPVRLLLADRYPSLERIEAVRCPLLVIAGDRDRIVPYEQSRALFEAAPGPSKQFVNVSGAGPNDLDLVHGPRTVEPTLRFLTRPEER